MTPDTEWPPSGPRRANGPPPPPPHTPAVALTLRQWIGIPILALIPLLALFGLLGEHLHTMRASNGRLSVVVTYPDRVHYRQTLTMQLTVHNGGATTIDTVLVRYDTTYLNAFLISGAAPPFTASYIAPLRAIAPDETRLSSLTVAGDRRGRSRGAVMISAGPDTVRVPLSTFVFP